MTYCGWFTQSRSTCTKRVLGQVILAPYQIKKESYLLRSCDLGEIEKECYL